MYTLEKICFKIELSRFTNDPTHLMYLFFFTENGLLPSRHGCFINFLILISFHTKLQRHEQLLKELTHKITISFLTWTNKFEMKAAILQNAIYMVLQIFCDLVCHTNPMYRIQISDTQASEKTFSQNVFSWVELDIFCDKLQ